MKILVTGFEPFNQMEKNASWEAVKCLPDKISGADIIGLQLPVEYIRGGQMVREAASRIKPALILSTGVAMSRKEVTPELIAVNWRMCSAPDNAGMSWSGLKIDQGAPAARMTALPVVEMVEAVKSSGIPCSLSLSAGSYVCNDVYWSILEAEADGGCPALFVHVPGMDSVAPYDAAKALEVIIRMFVES